MKRWLKTGAILFCLTAVLVLAGVYTGYKSLDAPLEVPNGSMTFTISPGTPFSAVTNALAAQGVLQHPQILRWYARISGQASAVQAGEYRIESGTSAREILDAFLIGNVQLYSFTIVEGWNFRELMSAIAADEAIIATLSSEDVPRLLEELGTSHQNPEGLFLPETYRFPRGTRDVDLLRQANAHLQKVLATEWALRDQELPFTEPYEALILASIVEKETARDDERARIAGVFISRIDKRMRLQTDPTVIYGIGPEFNGNLTRTDLRTDSPYNTYTRAGLPPTPICMAGLRAIQAVMHPAQGNELYFVATGIGDGSHQFSETKEQHDAAVSEFLARQKANRQSKSGK